MKINLKIWRQDGPNGKGDFKEYVHDEVKEEMSFLEMLDVLNDKLVSTGEEPVAFDHDCREGICGSCGVMIDGRPHGPLQGTTTCQLHMRFFNDGDTITIEPFRAKGFPIVKDLVVDRSAFDRINQKGGYVSVNTGSAPDANDIPIEKEYSDEAFDAAACIGCGACVATCKNASAMLFTAAKVSHLALMPQGDVERSKRVNDMVAQMEEEGFGNCTNTQACSAECPKEIDQTHIARLNREYLKAKTRFSNKQ